MKKYIGLLLVFGLFIACKQVTVAQSGEKHKHANVDGEDEPAYPKGFITTEYVAKAMNFLAGDELEGRDTGSQGYEMAAQFVEKEFKSLGIEPYFESYRDSLMAKGVGTFNVVGYLKGHDKVLANEFVIIGAHLDHIGKADEVNGDSIANGANDNAAGSSAVLALAKQLAELKMNQRSILFVLFGAEEKGLLGSKHLAKVLKDKNIDLYTMVNFEMIGVPLNDKSYQAYITGYDKSNMAAKINEYSGEELIGFLAKAKQFQLFQRSDNYPFYQQFKVPCQTISTFDFTNYEYYHHVDDETSEMNFEFMAELINKCLPAVLKISNTPSKEIKLN
ncbi:M20/M25/M40 family metallo-hydrolase [Aquimarina sp. D1M17]|uniref:M20/M25/M40 family metallo-hydrolase n=1 Tax=Aquimarina acroporae TaxID=2937283 RepID=UPI0020BF6E3A|nr:M20/M25/M40 family metallo-hydrolase [Aquimarina acroporae]MCK8521599.1 M20/M25/M40 family metallo-hydrolase [Aquimarina acroporae]